MELLAETAMQPPGNIINRESGYVGLPRVGFALKHYEVIRELGHGGMGTVFLARDTKLGRLVAIKSLREYSAEGAARFLVEARATARCKHENIVIIHEVDELHGTPYMVFEHLEGRTLRELLAAGEPPRQTAKSLAISSWCLWFARSAAPTASVSYTAISSRRTSS
jgi:serine/threonine protein kinase